MALFKIKEKFGHNFQPSSIVVLGRYLFLVFLKQVMSPLLTKEARGYLFILTSIT